MKPSLDSLFRGVYSSVEYNELALDPPLCMVLNQPTPEMSMLKDEQVFPTVQSGTYTVPWREGFAVGTDQLGLEKVLYVELLQNL